MIANGKERETTGLGRRRLLCGLATGGAAAALAGTSAGSAEQQQPRAAASAEGEHRRIGFRATEHTRWFYHRARW
jgi:hypothetical protein